MTPVKKGKKKTTPEPQLWWVQELSEKLERVALAIDDGFDKLCSILESPPPEEGPIRPLEEQETPQPPVAEEVKP